jgi:2-polyprenyl-3-methyl-5-hydroxy-6-metoxy-1,4-benzoquinol methylase
MIVRDRFWARIANPALTRTICMPSVNEHYESHLAPVYVWMAGGMDAAIARGRAEVDAVCPRPSSGQWAVDLGAGFGMHAIPLADLGYSVLAIDSSRILLDALRSHLGARAITTVRDDLLALKKHLTAPAALMVCMGDTLTHLPDKESVAGLCTEVADSLAGGGTFIATFRDYSTPLVDLKRFIPVRSDPSCIMTCFLEYEADSVLVHDILNEWNGSEWRQRISAYRKLRLAPDWVAKALQARGLQVKVEQGLAGMVRVCAKQPL